MKKIAVIANNKDYSRFIAEKLGIFFDRHAEFYCYGTSEVASREEMLTEDYVVLSAFTIFQQVKRKVRESAKLVIIDLTLNKQTLNKLYKVPKNARALLVSIDYRNCMEVITKIYNLGYKHFELIPYYPGCDYDESIQIAVTPGEAGLVPEKVSTVIDLEQRLIDANSVYKLAQAIGVEKPFESDAAKKELENMAAFNPEMESLLGGNSSLSVQMNTILKLVKQGIIITDFTGKIYLVNDMAAEIMGNRAKVLQGFNVLDIFPEFGLTIEELLGAGASDQLIRINGKDVIAAVSRVGDEDDIKGNIITLEYFNEAENRQHKLRNKIMGSGHKANYTFPQILGNSPVLHETKEIAMRMSRSDSSVCLFGESGTGKELFAQSIHNYSRRKNYNFVAINCSALPENLLESELYGYEEGAFSGARKGGKIGLFELAHKGTLFLDEIGELPLQMQAKLLRAIEEQKILKVGGKDLIDVDVRIICATNRNLQEMVESGDFRQDLYYRLCVLPISIPPLRKRGDDVFLLMNTMKEGIQADFTLSENAKARIRQYPWPGNVRELKNVTEYLANLGKTFIEADDIPLFFSAAPSSQAQAPAGLAAGTYSDPAKSMATAFSSSGGVPVWQEVTVGSDEALFRFILQEMAEAQRNQLHIGRQALAERAREQGFFATEQEIRRGLRILNEQGMIISYKGRRGSLLTEKGFAVLKETGSQF